MLQSPESRKRVQSPFIPLPSLLLSLGPIPRDRRARRSGTDGWASTTTSPVQKTRRASEGIGDKNETSSSSLIQVINAIFEKPKSLSKGKKKKKDLATPASQSRFLSHRHHQEHIPYKQKTPSRGEPPCHITAPLGTASGLLYRKMRLYTYAMLDDLL